MNGVNQLYTNQFRSKLKLLFHLLEFLNQVPEKELREKIGFGPRIDG